MGSACVVWWSCGGAVWSCGGAKVELLWSCVEPVHLAGRDGAQPVDELRQFVTLDAHGVAPDVQHLG